MGTPQRPAGRIQRLKIYLVKYIQSADKPQNTVHAHPSGQTTVSQSNSHCRRHLPGAERNSTPSRRGCATHIRVAIAAGGCAGVPAQQGRRAPLLLPPRSAAPWHGMSFKPKPPTASERMGQHIHTHTPDRRAQGHAQGRLCAPRHYMHFKPKDRFPLTHRCGARL